MAIYNGVNYAKTEVTQPSDKIAPGDQAGRLRCAYDEYTVVTALTGTDEILMMELPKGARVHAASVSSDSALGGTCDLSLGHNASEDGSEAKDIDAFVSLAATAGAAGFDDMSAGTDGSPDVPVAGLMKKYDQPVRVIVSASAAGAGTGQKISAAIYYSLD